MPDAQPLAVIASITPGVVDTWNPYDEHVRTVVRRTVWPTAAWCHTPVTTSSITTLSSVVPVAVGRMIAPYHAPVPVPAPVSVTGDALVPDATSVPATRSSARVVSWYACMMSPVANDSVAPGSSVSVTPGPTVRSPPTVIVPAGIVRFDHNVP